MTAIGAVDIGGTKIAVGIVDESGHLLSRVEAASREAEAYGDGVRLITRMLRQSMLETGAAITGVGIGSTGPVEPFTGRFGNLDFLPQWSGESLVDDLERAFHVPAALENDADAAALAEAVWGAGRNKSHLIYVTIGTGIGGGIILGGQLYRGVGGAHPEIGHQVIDAAGPPCSCGFHGCWESLAAGPAMARWMESQPEYVAAGELTAKLICEFARAGDALALRTIARETFYLGIGLANLVNLFTPDAVILSSPTRAASYDRKMTLFGSVDSIEFAHRVIRSGSVMKSADLFLDGIRKVLRQGCRFVPLERAELMLASLGEDANLIGAARVWHERFARDGKCVCPST